MIPASTSADPISDARLFVLGKDGGGTVMRRSRFPQLLHRGDLVVANDAATLPASLAGTHRRTGEAIEVRLASSMELDASDPHHFLAVLFGAGDFRTKTELRPKPPNVELGDWVDLGPLVGRVASVGPHPRLVALRFEGTSSSIWKALADHGRPVQYAHLQHPLALWDTWTSLAGPPVAMEPPSAGFAIEWATVRDIHARGAQFTTLTHAAGLSSTGDAELDACLPFAEPFSISVATAELIEQTRANGGRIIAVGTTVVRALESAGAESGEVRPGKAFATLVLGSRTKLRVVDALLSGLHDEGTSHYRLLEAFVESKALARATDKMKALRMRSHEFGDSCFIVRTRAKESRWAPRISDPL